MDDEKAKIQNGENRALLESLDILEREMHTPEDTKHEVTSLLMAVLSNQKKLFRVIKIMLYRMEDIGQGLEQDINDLFGGLDIEEPENGNHPYARED